MCWFVDVLPVGPYGSAGTVLARTPREWRCTVPVRLGDVIELVEGAYKYGKGPLKLRVTRVRRDLVAQYEGKWVWINGYEINWDGSESREERSFLVLITALPGGTL